MSFTDLKPYFNARLLTVDAKLHEHSDAFNEDNIPRNLLHKAWHLLYGTTGRQSQSQPQLLVNQPVTLNVWLKGYKKTGEGLDSARALGEAIVIECLKHSNRETQPYIKNVLFDSMDATALAASNDNTIKLSIGFIVLVATNIS